VKARRAPSAATRVTVHRSRHSLQHPEGSPGSSADLPVAIARLTEEIERLIYSIRLNARIDAAQGSFACWDEMKSLKAASFFSRHSYYSSSSRSRDLVCLLGCTRARARALGCANAKYVGRDFLFGQRLSNSLPAFVASGGNRHGRKKRQISRHE